MFDGPQYSHWVLAADRNEDKRWFNSSFKTPQPARQTNPDIQAYSPSLLRSTITQTSTFNMMYTISKLTLLLLSGAALGATSAVPESLQPRACSKLILPTNFYGISTTALDTTFDYGPHKPPLDPFFDFKVSQTSNGAQGLSEESDVIATYTNLPCTSSQTYNLEFYFDPISDYSYGGNTRVDIWRVNGNIPRDSTGKGTPTWNKMKSYALSFVGGFKMPASEAEQVRKVFQVGGFACTKEVSFRVSISNNPTPPQTGSVSYVQEYAGATDTGLRIRYSC